MILKAVKLTSATLLMIAVASCGGEETENETPKAEDEPTDETEVVDEVENIEEGDLSSVKYEKIETCPYFMYDDETGEYINEDPLPEMTLEEAKKRLENLSTLNDSYLGLEPPNKKSVQFTWYEGKELTMDVLNVSEDGSYVKVVTMEEAFEIMEIVFNGGDFSGIEGIVFESYL